MSVVSYAHMIRVTDTETFQNATYHSGIFCAAQIHATVILVRGKEISSARTKQPQY